MTVKILVQGIAGMEVKMYVVTGLMSLIKSCYGNMIVVNIICCRKGP